MIKYRLADKNDTDNLIKLQKSLFNNEFIYNGYCLESIIEKQKAYVVSYNNKLIAFAFFDKRYSSINNEELVNTLCLFGVSDKFQNKKIGTTLLNLSLPRFKCTYLHVKCDNINAIHLYEKLGFKKIKVIPGYYSPGEDGYYMKYENNS